jgi:hypothetical protein
MSLPGSGRAAFLSFLLDAKRATYAGRGDDATLAPLLPGSQQLEYRAGDYFYRDIYYGMGYFVGHEVVEYRERAVWSMTYAGGVIGPPREGADARAVYQFLRRALQQGSIHEPYRGPARFSEDRFAYSNVASGDFDAFWGLEQIAYGGDTVYELRYAGGFLR